MTKKVYAQALEFNEQGVYYPEIRPGYTAWASLFQFGNGDLGIALNEIRRGTNPDFQPPSLEFVEAMAVPYRLLPDGLPSSNPDLLSEYVNLKSTDGGKTWKETGRCPVYTRHYWHVGFPDGRLVRLIGTQHYRYELPAEDRMCNVVEESYDGGNTWKEIARFLWGKFFYGHKLKKLRNGSIIAAGPILWSFGPGSERAGRQTSIAGEIKPLQTCFMVSEDGGYTWDGPHYILPGIMAWEPDFVELPDGSLLFINSTVQTGRAVRQIVRKTPTGWVNEPLMEISRGAPTNDNVQGGFTPETVTIAEEDLIVGARRGGVYSCSNDLGENWYEIEGAANCKYQPIIESLGDGKFLAVWHEGSDTRFGEIDMFIGTHSFRVKADLPKPTKLTLERELSEDGNQYINAFRAKLTADGKPAEGREVEFRVTLDWLEDGRVNPEDVRDSKDVRKAITDENGIARIKLVEMNSIPDIHHGYRINVSFRPKAGDDLSGCDGPASGAYAMTPARNNPANYTVYMNHGLIMLTPPTAKEFPDLAEVLGTFDRKNPDVPFEEWVETAGSEKRAQEIIDFLTDNHLITLEEDGKYRWHRCVHCGEEIIKEVRVCDLEEHCT